MASSQNTIDLVDIVQEFRGGALRATGGKLIAVNNVSFGLSDSPPQIVNLVGQSGSGKSTLARIILGLQKPTSGHVTYGGKDIYRMDKHERIEYLRAVQPVFQDPYGIFNPFYPVDRVLWKAIRKFKLAKNKSEGLEVIDRSLNAVDLRMHDVIGRYPHQLSGGQRQRIMLARVHMLQPRFIIADEPVSMLDAAVRVLFLNLLMDFRDKYGMTTLFITHDLSTSYYVGGDIMVMHRGRIIEHGRVDDVLLNPQESYTRMLLSSVPMPDPDARWKGRSQIALEEDEEEEVLMESPDMEAPNV